MTIYKLEGARNAPSPADRREKRAQRTVTLVHIPEPCRRRARCRPEARAGRITRSPDGSVQGTQPSQLDRAVAGPSQAVSRELDQAGPPVQRHLDQAGPWSGAAWTKLVRWSRDAGPRSWTRLRRACITDGTPGRTTARQLSLARDPGPRRHDRGANQQVKPLRGRFSIGVQDWTKRPGPPRRPTWSRLVHELDQSRTAGPTRPGPNPGPTRPAPCIAWSTWPDQREAGPGHWSSVSGPAQPVRPAWSWAAMDQPARVARRVQIGPAPSSTAPGPDQVRADAIQTTGAVGFGRSARWNR